MTDHEGRRYYLEQHNGSNLRSIRVYCKYNSTEEFQKDTEERLLSLEKAISTYLAEGPAQSADYELPAGSQGCTEATPTGIDVAEDPHWRPPKFADLKQRPFLLVFDMPEPIPGVVEKFAKLKVVFRRNRWFAMRPGSKEMHIFDSCGISDPHGNTTKVCFKNIILTYEEDTGLFHVGQADFQDISKRLISQLPNWLMGATIARAETMTQDQTHGDCKDAAVPCVLNWRNSYQLDPKRSENCIHFSAATSGDIFLVFASIPQNSDSWYYIRMSSRGASFYRGRKCQYTDPAIGVGIKGIENLFESLFVCLNTSGSSLQLQYGKADPDKEIGTVFSSFTFHGNPAPLTSFAFGAGEKPVSLMDVRLTTQVPSIACFSENFMTFDPISGSCIPICHPECIDCRHPHDPAACHSCKNVEADSDGRKKCVAECPAGAFLPENSTVCSKCNPGYRKSRPGNHECSACPSGTITDRTGTVTCKGCLPGHFRGDGDNLTRCEECKPGFFTNRTGQAECKKCPAGQFSSARGSIMCQECAAGYFTNIPGSTECSECPPYTMSAIGSSSCPIAKCNIFQYKGRNGLCQNCSGGRLGMEKNEPKYSLYLEDRRDDACYEKYKTVCYTSVYTALSGAIAGKEECPSLTNGRRDFNYSLNSVPVTFQLYTFIIGGSTNRKQVSAVLLWWPSCVERAVVRLYQLSLVTLNGERSKLYTERAQLVRNAQPFSKGHMYSYFLYSISDVFALELYWPEVSKRCNWPTEIEIYGRGSR